MRGGERTENQQQAVSHLTVRLGGWDFSFDLGFLVWSRDLHSQERQMLRLNDHGN